MLDMGGLLRPKGLKSGFAPSGREGAGLSPTPMARAISGLCSTWGVKDSEGCEGRQKCGGLRMATCEAVLHQVGTR
jgi:hypothetical protein